MRKIQFRSSFKIISPSVINLIKSVINLIKSSFISANKSIYSFICLLDRWSEINILINYYKFVSYCNEFHRIMRLISIIVSYFIFASSQQRCSIKKVLLKILQNSKGNACTSLSFNKFADLRPATLLKKGLSRRHFFRNFGKFLRTSFRRTPPGDCFCIFNLGRC